MNKVEISVDDLPDKVTGIAMQAMHRAGVPKIERATVYRCRVHGYDQYVIAGMRGSDGVEMMAAIMVPA